MYAVGRLGSYISRGVYTVSGPFHPFGGAVDIIVVEQPDGSYKSSPWYVRFGKFQGVLKAREEEVTIEVNGVERDFHMVLDQRGEAYFYRELEGEGGEGEGESLCFSSSSGDEMDEQSQKNGRPMKSLSVEYDGTNGSGDLINVNNGNNLARTNSRQSRISGIVFGRRLMEDDVYHKSGSGVDAAVERAEMTADLVENFRLDDLEEKLAEISETSRNMEEFNLQDADQVCDAEDVVSEVSDSQTVTVNKQAEDVEFERKDIESHDTYAQRTIPSTPSSHSHDEVSFEVPATVSPFTQMVYVDPVPVFDSGEIESNNISSITSFTNSGDRIQDDVSIGNEITRNGRQSSLESVGVSEQFNGDDDQAEATNILVSESSQEDQFFFSDVDDSEPREGQVELGFPDAAGEDSHPPSCREGISIMNDPVCTNDESYSSPCSLQKLTEASNLTSSPISIMKHHNTGGPEVARMAESLPNLWSNMNNMDKEDSPCSLSHSLDLNSKSFEWKMRHGNESNSSNSEISDDNPLVHGYSKDENNLCLEHIKDGVRNPAVEISLCKHFLHEGMGAEAASQAFDAQKLDIRKFTSIGPEVVKNDRLVVRIRGYYFPWDAACPAVLGMVAFGSENIFELKGMIPVDRVEKSLVGDQSETTVTTGGGWRLWPFGFRRSRSRKGTQPTPNNNRSSDTENGLESNAVLDTESNVLDGLFSKKIVKAVTPTSGELKSLNLKEGSNEVIFTFSTAMLGRQKVDARIYLWKWNTRIVISDVDGTITKSDVLGQFMPLVGIDWSQTGVTHLFSAIKDNGYQFLYLSARAISQAYITRQFLVNLKQDGKALADGPVVISPDGLFPSLFREVIRRAPHEFKIACLEEIKALFPSDCNPFYAGFGNRDTDEISYLKVGIPKGKIFIINPKGEVAVNRLVDTRSYTSLHALVHGMFPAMTSSEQEDYNSWNFWKLPPPDIDM